MQPVTHLGQRSPGDSQKLQSFSTLISRKSFDDVRRYRIRRSAQLGGKFEPFIRWKRRFSRPVNVDVGIVRPLPRNQPMVSKRHDPQYARTVPPCTRAGRSKNGLRNFRRLWDCKNYNPNPPNPS